MFSGAATLQGGLEVDASSVLDLGFEGNVAIGNFVEDGMLSGPSHLEGSAAGTFGKLEGFVLGTFMGGAAPQSGDFMLFEMIDQHMAIAAAVGAPAFFDAYPKLKKFHATMKGLPALAPYFASAPYASWAQNNGLFTHFTGQPASFDYGPSVSETITF